MEYLPYRIPKRMRYGILYIISPNSIRPIELNRVHGTVFFKVRLKHRNACTHKYIHIYIYTCICYSYPVTVQSVLYSKGQRVRGIMDRTCTKIARYLGGELRLRLC